MPRLPRPPLRRTARSRADGVSHVPEPDVPNVEIKLQQGASISGTVVIEGMSLPEAAPHFPELYLGAANPSSINVPRYTRPQIGTDGSFRINGLQAGKTRMTLFGYPRRNATLLRVERDGIDITEGIDLAAVPVVRLEPREAGMQRQHI